MQNFILKILLLVYITSKLIYYFFIFFLIWSNLYKMPKSGEIKKDIRLYIFTYLNSTKLGPKVVDLSHLQMCSQAIICI